MRLTLRTLLAYIDNILDKEDQEELSQRIAASDVAHDLIHRARDVTRRLRLPAPELDASGPYSDANTVAEYLDNMLPPDDVTEFERRCVEFNTYPDADSHLAEVANCHHVLTMVLGQRADIDAETKRRIYSIGQTSAETPRDTPAPAVQPAQPHVNTVPDYLRASERSLFSRLLPAIAALLLLGISLYFAYGPNGFMRPAENEVADAGEQGGTAPEWTPPETDTPPPPIEAPTTGDPAAELPELPSGDEVALPPLDVEGAPLDVEGAMEPAEPPALPEIAPQPTGEGAAPVVPDTPPVLPTIPEPSTPAIPLPAETTTPEPAMPDAPSVDPPGEGITVTPEPPSETPDEEPLEEPAEPEPPKRIGLVGGIKQVLLRLSPEDDHWRRVELRSEVKPGERLLSLPTYRPTINLDAGVAVDMVNASLVETLDTGDQSPGIKIVYGRVVLTNTSQAPKELTLSIGDKPGLLRLAPGASLAVSVRRPFQPGVDPRKAPAPLQAECLAPRGGVEWSGEGFSITAKERGRWSFADGAASPVEEYQDDPAWLAAPKLTAVKREASPKLEAQLKTVTPAWEQLSVLSESRLKDVRALASISMIHTGQFDTTVQALRDETQELSWGDEIEALRFAMSSSPALAEEVHKELHRQHPEDRAGPLYEMLCGYNLSQVGQTPDEWRVGAMRKLLDWMESNQLDFRVLAYYNMVQITNRHNVFSPAGTSGNREIQINRQRARLEDGELRPNGLIKKDQ